MTETLNINPDTVRSFILHLRKWHAGEGATGQNDGSNDTDDIHDELEMHPGRVDRADLEGIYNDLDHGARTDLSALLLVGMEEEGTLAAARQRIDREEGFSLDDLLEMPLAPQYLASALSSVRAASGDNVYRLHPESAGSDES